jgi:hypothetical protein
VEVVYFIWILKAGDVSIQPKIRVEPKKLHNAYGEPFRYPMLVITVGMH